MRFITLAACVLTGCGETRAATAPAPDSATPQTASTPSSTSTPNCGPGECEPPFASVSELPPHELRRWRLMILLGLPRQDFHPGSRKPSTAFAFYVAETRAGDIPLPPGCPWKCRFGSAFVHRHILTGEPPAKWPVTYIERKLSCSNDGWRTSVTTSGMYGMVEGARVDDGAELNLGYRDPPPPGERTVEQQVEDSQRGKIELIFDELDGTQWSASKYSELP